MTHQNDALRRMTTGCRPYPGLRPFRRDEDHLFFGRETQTIDLVRRLGATHFIAVLGSSGSGKSSLVRAGLLSALEGGLLASARARWQIAELRPGAQPLDALAEALVKQTDWGRAHASSATDLADLLGRGPMALGWQLGLRPLANGERLLLVVDQFEELFRFERETAAAQADAFVALLLEAATHSSVYVVITMRSDFLSDCSRHAGLPEAVNVGLYLTSQLDAEQLADAIRLPARVCRGEVEPALVERLLAAARGQQDQLPLLAHALMRLWDAAGGAHRLTLAAFDALGGLPQALDRHAEEAFATLDQNQQRIAEVLLRGLTEPGSGERDTRRPARLGELAQLPYASPAAPPDGGPDADPNADPATSGDADSDATKQAAPDQPPADASPDALTRFGEVVEVFRAPGLDLLMPPPPDSPGGEALTPDSMLDITHETLIRQWRRLQAWTRTEGSQAELYRRPQGDARRRADGGEAKASLWSGAELGLARPWLAEPARFRRWAARHAAGSTPAERAASLNQALGFLRESRQAADRRAEHRIGVWDLTTDPPTRTRNLSAGEDLLMWAEPDPAGRGSFVAILDAATGAPLARLSDHEQTAYKARFLPGGRGPPAPAWDFDLCCTGAAGATAADRPGQLGGGRAPGPGAKERPKPRAQG